MCYIYGSIDQATGICPMCKVFKPSAARCPHVMEVCRNRSLHPRHDVLFLKNAEVQTFNGCGYCKWARTNPIPKFAGYQNPGWPGCCRPPLPTEQAFVGAADWPAVSIVHRIPIPSNVKAILDSLTVTSPSRDNHSPTHTNSQRSQHSQQTTPTASRRASYNPATTGRSEGPSAKTSPVAIPSKSRSGGSPQQPTSSLASVSTKEPGDLTSSSLPNASALEQHFHTRQFSTSSQQEKRSEPPSVEPKLSPGRRHADLGGSISRKGTGSSAASGRRPSVSSAFPSSSLNKVTIDAQPRRKPSGTPNASPPQSIASRSGDRHSPGVPARRSLEKSLETMSIGSASSNSSGSKSETTVVSDGGFTDYLSDESDLELQRQAEIKAAQVAQNQMEELEFRAAKQQLVNVDLRPPKSWTRSTSATRIQPAASYASGSYSQNRG